MHLSIHMFCMVLKYMPVPTYLDELMKLNNTLLRILQCKPITTPICELYKTCNTLLITDLHKQQLLLFVHKFIHHPELLPEIFINNKFFTFNDEIHKYNTRIESNIQSGTLNPTIPYQTSIYISQLLPQDLDQCHKAQ